VIPAVTHIDGTARIQTVAKEITPRFHALIDEFRRLSGVPVVVNTSFNLRGEPIVCTPQDALKCFYGTDVDFLVIGNCVVSKPF
jgi:carbamoyltransferase